MNKSFGWPFQSRFLYAYVCTTQRCAIPLKREKVLFTTDALPDGAVEVSNWKLDAVKSILGQCYKTFFDVVGNACISN
jgi:hypothetical protein